MAQIELKPSLKLKDEYARGDVSGIIGMVGPQVKGSFSASFEENLACEIMHKMLGELPDSVDEEVCDMVGEITNMVTGGAKKSSPSAALSLIWPHRSSSRDATILYLIALRAQSSSCPLTMLPVRHTSKYV